MKKTLIVILTVLVSTTALSQELSKLIDHIVYEYDEVVSILGVPDSCVHDGYGDDFYHYGKCVIQIGTPAAGGMVGVGGVSLKDGSIPILKEKDGIGLRVGDPFSKLKDLAPDYYVYKTFDNGYEIWLCPECDCEAYFFTLDEKGIITSIYIWIAP